MRQQKLKIQTDALAGSSQCLFLLQFLLPVLGQLSIKIHPAARLTGQQCAIDIGCAMQSVLYILEHVEGSLSASTSPCKMHQDIEKRNVDGLKVEPSGSNMKS